MSNLVLRPVRDDELPEHLERQQAGYAQQMAELGGMEPGDAWAKARRDTALLFPAGRPTPGHRVLVAELDGEVVGRLWLAPDPTQTDVVFVYDVEVEPHHRGKGLGRAIMAAAEAQAGDMGATAIELNVFGGNATAIGLYASLGYSVSSQHMRKRL